MSLLRSIKTLRLMDSLIRRKATGNQNEFSQKIGVCRSMLNEYLNEMKALGFPISYCRHKNTYYYSEEGGLVPKLFQASIDTDAMRSINGGSMPLFDFIIDYECYNFINCIPA